MTKEFFKQLDKMEQFHLKAIEAIQTLRNLYNSGDSMAMEVPEKNETSSKKASFGEWPNSYADCTNNKQRVYVALCKIKQGDPEQVAKSWVSLDDKLEYNETTLRDTRTLLSRIKTNGKATTVGISDNGLTIYKSK